MNSFQQSYLDNLVPPCGDDDKPVDTIYRVNERGFRTARKQHKAECGAIIEKGEVYEFVYQQGWHEWDDGYEDADEDGRYWVKKMVKGDYFKINRKYKIKGEKK